MFTLGHVEAMEIGVRHPMGPRSARGVRHLRQGRGGGTSDPLEQWDQQLPSLLEIIREFSRSHIRHFTFGITI